MMTAYSVFSAACVAYVSINALRWCWKYVKSYPDRNVIYINDSWSRWND